MPHISTLYLIPIGFHFFFAECIPQLNAAEKKNMSGNYKHIG